MLPAERALKVISGRWKAIILYHLFEGPRRLSELQRLLPDVSQKVLIQQLREMEEHGIVHREVFRQVPRASNTAQRRLASALSRCCWHSASGVAGMPSSLTKPTGSRTARSKPRGGIAGLRRRGCAPSDDDFHCTPRC